MSVERGEKVNDCAISSRILEDNGVMPEQISSGLLQQNLVRRSSDGQHFEWSCYDFESGETTGTIITDHYGYILNQTGKGSFHFVLGEPRRLVVCESLPLMADYLTTMPKDNCCFLLAHETKAVGEAMAYYGRRVREIHLYYSFRKSFLKELAEAFPENNVKAYCVH